MRRRQFGREFKIEAVRLIKDRGVSVAQASRDLDVHENQLRKWVKLFSADPAQAFPGHGQMKPEQLEIEKLRREVAKLRPANRWALPAAQPVTMRKKPDRRRLATTIIMPSNKAMVSKSIAAKASSSVRTPSQTIRQAPSSAAPARSR